VNTPRPYQSHAHGCILKKLETDRATILHICTGGGKTFIASMTINSFKPKRVLFLANTDELIDQAVADIQANCGVKVAIEKAGQFASTDLFGSAPVVVSSIQTQISGKPGTRRYMRFKPTDFDLVICDECHLSIAKSWRETLGWYQQNPNLKILGLSATPKRTDEQAMGQVYQSVAYQYDILDAIKDGWLVPIVQQTVRVNGLDFSHIKTTAGDLNEGQLAAVMEQEKNIHDICQPVIEAMYGLEPKTLHNIAPPEWKTYLKSLNVTPRRTLVYTVSVAQAEMCCNVFSRAVDGVEWLCGKTNKQLRKDMIARFAIGTTCCLVNVSCLTHGFNNPAVEVIAFARPTKSWLLKMQITGRGTRALPGVVDGLATAEERKAAIAASPKKFIRFLDFVGVN
jgi:ATP-dependent helicase IRC3